VQIGATLLPLTALRPHERVKERKVQDSLHIHVRWGRVRRRIVVEHEHGVVLDGHHRLAVAHRLGLLRVPVVVVEAAKVPVVWRSTSVPIDPATVVEAALSGVLMAPRSTMHDLSMLDVDCDVPLDHLRHPAGWP
jgi:hypothetical protein